MNGHCVDNRRWCTTRRPQSARCAAPRTRWSAHPPCEGRTLSTSLATRSRDESCAPGCARYWRTRALAGQAPASSTSVVEVTWPSSLRSRPDARRERSARRASLRIAPRTAPSRHSRTDCWRPVGHPRCEAPKPAPRPPASRRIAGQANTKPLPLGSLLLHARPGGSREREACYRPPSCRSFAAAWLGDHRAGHPPRRVCARAPHTWRQEVGFDARRALE